MQQLHNTHPPDQPADLTRARPEGPQGQRIWSACSRQQSTVPVGGPQHHPDPRAHGITVRSVSRTNAGPIFPPPRRPRAAGPGFLNRKSSRGRANGTTGSAWVCRGAGDGGR
jgi:hypothetical protein